jgi:hypothetical protein
LIFSESFDTECPEGQFLDVYGKKWTAYPKGWKDTSKKGNSTRTSSRCATA